MRCLSCPTVFATEDDLYRHVADAAHTAFIPALISVEGAA